MAAVSSSVPLQGACGQEMEHHTSRGGFTSAGLASSLTFLSVEMWAARRSRFVGWQLHELPSVGTLGAHGPGEVGIHPPAFFCALSQSWHCQHDYTVFLTNSETQNVPWVTVNSSLPRAETACTNVPWRPGWPGMQPGLSDTPSWQLLFSSCMPARTK